MTKITQQEFEGFPVDKFGRKQCPTGDYSEIKTFGENAYLDPEADLAIGAASAWGAYLAIGAASAGGAALARGAYLAIGAASARLTNLSNE